MAGVPWSKYDRSDWRRLPGAQRRYVSIHNPDVTISRRQFDEHYGSAASYGSYERKARAKSKEPEALARPARGRTSARKLSPAQREVELQRRKVEKQETETTKKIQRLQGKQRKYPHTIDLRSFKKGKVFRRVELPVDYSAVESVRAAAAKSRIVFGYYVGANMIDDRSGEPRVFSLFGLRDINMPFTHKDFNNLLKKAREKSYASLVSLWIHLTLKSDVATKRNGWKGRR